MLTRGGKAEMSLAHAILGWLHKEPMSGYDLKKQFDQGIGYFWPADQMQIYRTLERLVEQGMAVVHEEIQHERPNRKIYTVTDTGREELRHWLTSPQSLPIFRDPLLIQLFFAAPLSNVEIIHLLEQQHAAHSERLVSYQQMLHFPLDAPVGTPEGVSRRQMLRRQIQEYGLLREQAYLGWLEQTIEAVHHLPEDERNKTNQERL
jgi:PadR family transcriptional regulator, regulatory protein AphA